MTHTPAATAENHWRKGSASQWILKMNVNQMKLSIFIVLTRPGINPTGFAKAQFIKLRCHCEFSAPEGAYVRKEQKAHSLPKNAVFLRSDQFSKKDIVSYHRLLSITLSTNARDIFVFFVNIISANSHVYYLISILVANRYFRQNAAFAFVFSRDASVVA